MPAAPDPGAGGLPPLRAVTRTAILDRLEAAGPAVPLVVVTGSVGYGKSTLMLQYGDRRNLHRRHQVSNVLDGALEPNHSGIIALIHKVDVETVKA